jgi:DNA repair exonuclease SbcCD nuclease subunit
VVILFSDLHLTEKTEETCWLVLDRVCQLALDDDKRIVFLGDFFEVRERISVKMVNRVLDIFAGWREKGLTLDMVPGNHDQVDINGANALEIFQYHDFARVWTKGGLMGTDGFVPYRKNLEEQKALIEAVVAQGAVLIFGHFAVCGAAIRPGCLDSDGVRLPGRSERPSYFYLGHYHYQQVMPEYCYIGSPYQMSFGEAGNLTGVCAMGGDGRGVRFIPFNFGPRYYIVRWDLGGPVPEKPADYREGIDKIRVDVAGDYSLLANPKLLKELEKSGMGDAQVNVLPRSEGRDHKFEMQAGEDLKQIFGRYLRERVKDKADSEYYEKLAAVLDEVLG